MKLLRNIFILLLLSVQSLYGQNEKQQTFMQRLGKVFSETDTTYIAPNKYNLAFMIEQSFWHERYKLGTRIDG